MKNYLDLMSQNLGTGLESVASEREYTEEELMMQEIAIESAIDDAHVDFENALMGSSVESAYNFMTDLVEFELTKEVAVGVEASVVYDSFGLTPIYKELEKDLGTEAAKDVLARKGKMAWAAIKALLNTCLTWLKGLFGMNQTAGKVFSSLETKAKTIKKDLAAKSNKKANSDKDQDIYESAPNAVKELGEAYANLNMTVSGVKSTVSGAGESISIPVTAEMLGLGSIYSEDEFPITAVNFSVESFEDAIEYFASEADKYESYEAGMEAVEEMAYDFMMSAIESEIVTALSTPVEFGMEANNGNQSKMLTYKNNQPNNGPGGTSGKANVKVDTSELKKRAKSKNKKIKNVKGTVPKGRKSNASLPKNKKGVSLTNTTKKVANQIVNEAPLDAQTVKTQISYVRAWYDELGEKIQEVYDKDDRRTVSSTSLYNAGMLSLETVIMVCTKNKKVDAGKSIKDAIQAVEKARDELDKRGKMEMQDGKVKPEDIVTVRAVLNDAIAALNKANTVGKGILKEFVRASEGCLSNGRMAVSGMNAK